MCIFLIESIGGTKFAVEARNICEIAEKMQLTLKKDHTPLIYKKQLVHFMSVVTADEFGTLNSNEQLLAIFEDDIVCLKVKDVSRKKELILHKLTFEDAVEKIKGKFNTEKTPKIFLNDLKVEITQESFYMLQPNVELLALFDNEEWMSEQEEQELQVALNKKESSITCKNVFLLSAIGLGLLSVYTILHIAIKQ